MAEIRLPDIRLDERVVILTGADRGLGRAMSLALAGKGARMVLASRATERLEPVAAEITALAGAGNALVATTDITDLDSCRRLVAQTLDHFGALDVLVNNARRRHRGPGIPPRGNALPVNETDPMIWRETVMVNVVGTYFMTHAALPHFIGRRGGKIVNLSTSLRNFHRATQSPYGVTKAAIEAETLIWSKDLEGTGVTVNSLLPGGACDSDPERVRSPDQKLLPIDIMNSLVIWLASTRSDHVTGGRFVGRLWDPALAPDDAAQGAREEPVFHGQGAD